MKPGFGPVFQFRAAFSLSRSVDDLWMALNIVAGLEKRLGSAQQKPDSHPASALVRYSGGP